MKLVHRGALLVGACAFHRSSKPTLSIDAKANTWSCAGKCKVRAGTVIEWTMRAEGVSRRHAIELLRSGPSSSTAPAKPARKSTVKKLPLFADAEEPDHAVMTKVIDYYHSTLKQSPAALAFVKELGFRPEAIEHFRLGFVDRTLGYRLPERNRKAGKAIRGQLARLGILRASGHEHFRGCVVFPVLDDAGHVQQVLGHRVGHSTRGEPTTLWLDPKKKAAFNVAGITAPTVIVCSSIIDAITFWCAGCPSVTAVNGLYGFNTEHPDALKAKQVTQVMIAFERNDKANTAAEKLGAMLAEHGMTAYRVTLPQGMTPTEYALEGPPAGKGLGDLVRHATWLAGARPVQEQQEPTSVASTASASTVVGKANKDAEHEVVLRFDDRRWRIRGIERNATLDTLTLNVLVARLNEQQAFHVDNFDLYAAKQRAAFTREAASELGLDEAIIKTDLGRVLLELEKRQHAVLEAQQDTAKKQEMTAAEREEAMTLLRGPNLVARIIGDLERCGLVGEPDNKLLTYLATVSRKLDEPLAIVVQSSSAAGKSSLLDGVLAFVPEEDKVHFSAMTGQSLYYMGESELSHRVLSVAEEAGARRSSYALKLLQSEGQLRIASTGKEPSTGRLITQEYRVRGPVALMMTTTSTDLDEELLNRCIVLAVDEGREQTRAIHDLQRRKQTLEGLLAREDKEAIVRLHQNAQRLLRQLPVVNPFVHELRFVDGQTRSRRDHAKYLGLIRAMTLLHQFQRPLKFVEHRGRRLEYVEVDQADIALANKLTASLLSVAGDELSPQTRKVLVGIDQLVKKLAAEMKLEPSAVQLTQRMVREHLGLSATPVKRHLGRLVELEYLVVVRGGPRRQTFYVYDPIWAHPQGTWLSLGSPPLSPIDASSSAPLSDLGSPDAKARHGTNGKSTSYTQVGR